MMLCEKHPDAIMEELDTELYGKIFYRCPICTEENQKKIDLLKLRIEPLIQKVKDMEREDKMSGEQYIKKDITSGTSDWKTEIYISPTEWGTPCLILINSLPDDFVRISTKEELRKEYFPFLEQGG